MDDVGAQCSGCGAVLLRQALIRAIQPPLRQAGITLAQILRGDGDTAFEARQDLAGQPLPGRRAMGRDLDAILHAHAAAALPEPARCPTPWTPP